MIVHVCSKFFKVSIEAQKFLLPVQPNLKVWEKNGCEIRIQRPKNVEYDHTH